MSDARRLEQLTMEELTALRELMGIRKFFCTNLCVPLAEFAIVVEREYQLRHRRFGSDQ